MDATERKTDGFPASMRVFLTLFIAATMVAVLYSLLNNSGSGPGPLEQSKVNIRASMGLLDTLKERTGKLPDHRMASAAASTEHGGRVALSDIWVEMLVLTYKSVPDTAEGLRTMGEHVVTDSNRNGFMEIVDGWGRPLIYVNGVSHSDAFTEDDFLAEHKKPFLVSPGPDGRFGDVRDPKDKAWADNVYSFNLE